MANNLGVGAAFLLPSGANGAAFDVAGQPRSSLTTTANSVVTGREVPLPGGRTVEFVTFVPNAAVPHGRLYGWVELLLNGEVVGVLGGAYITASAASRPTSPSFPVSIPVLPGMSFRARAAANSNGGSVRVDCIATLSTNPPQYAQPIYEAPGTGPGEEIRVEVADPAAGADVVLRTGAAQTVTKVLTVHAQLVTDGTAATRVVRYLMDQGSGTQHALLLSDTQTAGLTVIHSAAIGASRVATSGGVANAALPDALLRAGDRLRTSTPSLQAGDQWSGAVLLVHEWAIP